MADLASLPAGERVRVLGGRNFEKRGILKHSEGARLKRSSMLDTWHWCSTATAGPAYLRFHGGMEGTIVRSLRVSGLSRM